MSKVCAVIVAAGKGTRMGPGMDKLFLEVCGRPIIAHTWAAFDASPDIGHIVLVIRTDLQAEFDKLAANHGFKKPFTYAAGGAERQNSVWNGLRGVPPGTEFVAIQDGARPCITQKIIHECIAAARETGAAVAAQRVTDTLKEIGENKIIGRHLDRSKVWSVQTPQVFRKEIIEKALDEAFKRRVVITDDTAACEFIGQQVKLVESTTPNPKVTSPADVPYVELLLRTAQSH
ncbi:MAG: 2-C-methyl-D-erythritol 4-phosphate cytidylyltransferase [Limisphaerales bacterium]